MCFQDVAFLPSRASFSTTFPKNCGRGKRLRTTICHRTVVGGKQGHAPCTIPLHQQSLFLCQLNSYLTISNLTSNLQEGRCCVCFRLDTCQHDDLAPCWFSIISYEESNCRH